jgi:hypothetical protein
VATDLFGEWKREFAQSTFLRFRLALLVTGSALLTGPALRGQTCSVQRIEVPPGAASLIPTGLDSQEGHAVGLSQFFGSPPVLRSWIRTPETGLVFVLPHWLEP